MRRGNPSSSLPRGDGGGGGFLDRVRWIPVVNDSGEVIPPHSLVEVTGTDADGRWTVDQPSADSLPNLLVSGPLPIADGRSGVATPDGFVPVAYDDAGTPAVGQTWGSAAGSWLLTKGKSGWAVVGDPDAGRTTVPAVRAPAAAWPPVTKTSVTNVCVVRDTYGALSGIRVEYTPRTYGPTGVTDGTPYCVLNPTNCVCPFIGPSCCDGGPPAIVNPALQFGSKTGAAVCLPDSVALGERETQAGDFLTPVDAVDAGAGVLPLYPVWTFCGGEYAVIILVDIQCRTDGTDGYLVRLQVIWYIPSSYNFGTSPLSDGWLAPGAGNVAFEYIFEALLACNAFDSPGSVTLGTITDPADFVSSVELSFSWS